MNGSRTNIDGEPFANADTIFIRSLDEGDGQHESVRSNLIKPYDEASASHDLAGAETVSMFSESFSMEVVPRHSMMTLPKIGTALLDNLSPGSSFDADTE